VFSVAKAFIRWLAGRETIDLPRNIENTGFRFGSSAKTVKTWIPEEFQFVVSEAPGKLKLALLLMANCGMTQEDVSDLKDAEVDWKDDRIRRKRSKTAQYDQVPEVEYKLWPLTFELLKRHRSGQETVLLTEKGKPFVRTRLKDNGKLSKADGFASCWVHLKKRLQKTRPGFDRPLKQLRKTAASLLDKHPEFSRFSTLFLGHSPRSVKDRYYVQPSQDRFDAAVLWLGQQFGQVEPQPVKPAKKAKGRR
jgi:integrase